MTDIEAKALALMNEVSDERAIPRWTTFYRKGNGFVEALCRAIEQHEAFRQEVSDALLNASGEPLERFIIRKPKPDPLVEVVHKLGWDKDTAADLRAALEYSGLEIREKGQ